MIATQANRTKRHIRELESYAHKLRERGDIITATKISSKRDFLLEQNSEIRELMLTAS